MSFDLYQFDLRILLHQLRDLVERGFELSFDDGLVVIEEDLLVELDGLRRDHDLGPLGRDGTTFPLGRTCLVRALVVPIKNTILIIVRIWAAVLILEAIDILCF